MPLAALDHASLAFGHVPLLDDVVLQIESGERIALVGRNGSGKSTLLQILSGERATDAGRLSRRTGLRIARLAQDVPCTTARSVFDLVADGLGDISGLVRAYHRAARGVAEEGSPAKLAALGELQHQLEQQDGWRVEQRVEMVLSRLNLAPEAMVDTLSGGWRRRVLLAQALVAQPDLLLLDEPTNHLDLSAIVWLEAFLADYPGAVVFVTHDRAFLQRLATRIVEIDRGRVASWPGDYAQFVRRKEDRLADERAQREKFDKQLAGEEAWLRQGVKARRTRNEGRVRALMTMRQQQTARRTEPGAVRLHVEHAERSGDLVFSALGVSKTFGSEAVVRGFSVRVLRGDRIGLIGPNGSGKTTLLRLLLGELAPDRGHVERGANVQLAYYDQQREQLDPERTVFDTVGDGNDTVTINGVARHVNAYLRDFLFPPERASSPVKALSGGERNRLLFARLLTRPANVLVLDEPTNDLDLETLELVEAELVRWRGTLLLVSHDRAFLDNIVTSTLVFEGDGRVQAYAGGYNDWLRQHKDPGPVVETGRSVSKPLAEADAAPDQDASRTKLSYRERRELEELPARIEELEAEQGALNSSVADSTFYRQGTDVITATLDRLKDVERDLNIMYARWDALDSRDRRA